MKKKKVKAKAKPKPKPKGKSKGLPPIDTGNFTPGPWTVSQEWCGTTDAEYSICAKRVPRVPNDWPIKGGIDNREDAHLIAAAPDMFAVLREFCDDIERVGVENFAGGEVDDWPDIIITYEHAKTALAKAEAKESV